MSLATIYIICRTPSSFQAPLPGIFIR
jgi:hypothetical protein